MQAVELFLVSGVLLQPKRWVWQVCYCRSACSFGVYSVNTSPRPEPARSQQDALGHSFRMVISFGISSVFGTIPASNLAHPSPRPRVALPRRARSAPPAPRSGHPRASHGHRVARRRAAGRRVAARQTHRARRQHGQWEDHARPRDRRGHGVRAWLGGLHRRHAHARRTRLGASGRRRRSVDDPPARRHARCLVRRRPAAQWRLRARRAGQRATALARGGRASHTARARIERGVRRDGRSNWRRYAAWWSGTTGR